MKVKKYSPFKAPNEIIDIKDIKFPQIISYKLDGIRGVFKDGEMLTSALKHFRNIHLIKKFEHLAKLSKEKNINLEGEFRAKSTKFNILSGIIRSDDKELPEDLFFYCFDCVVNEEYNKKFINRIKDIEKNCLGIKDVKVIPQYYLEDDTRIPELFKKAVEEEACDGLILHNPEGRYKLGRATIKEALIFKLKPYRTFDAKIIGVCQATVVIKSPDDMFTRLCNEGKITEHDRFTNERVIELYEAEYGSTHKINELGRSVTSKKKGDRILINRASAFMVLYHKKELKVTIGRTEEERTEIWLNKEKYIGRWIEFKGMTAGSKDLPRSPNMTRWREDLDE